MAINFAGGTYANAAVTSIEPVSDEIPLNGKGVDLAFSLTNTGAAALTAFQLQAKVRGDSDFITVIDGADWATTHPSVEILKGAPVTLAGAATATAVVKLGPWHSVRFQASCGTTTSTSMKVSARLES